MVYVQRRISSRKRDTVSSLGFWNTTRQWLSTKKRTCRIVDFAVPTDHRVKLIENEKREITEKKTMEHESDNDTNCNWCAQYNHQRIGTEIGGLKIRGRMKTI